MGSFQTVGLKLPDQAEFDLFLRSFLKGKGFFRKSIWFIGVELSQVEIYGGIL
jgi:hypothetical protein